MSREEIVEKLLGLTIGDLRERLAHADADWFLDEWVNDYDGLADIKAEDEEWDNYDDDDWDDEDFGDEEEDEEEDNYWDDDEDEDEEDTPSLTDEERELADSIVNDIDNGHYTLDVIKGVYSSQIVDYVENNID